MMNTIIVSTFILIINFTHMICADPHHRREPVGFQGTRGRRSVDFAKNVPSSHDNYATHNQRNDNEALNHDAAGDNQESVAASTESIISELPRQIVKRAPSMGFQGMRGKKDDELFDEMDKRYPMGFQGVRGKKFLINFPHRYYYYSPKRAPSGFMGMRGKKDYLDPEVFNYLTNDDDQKLYQALLNNNLLNRLYDAQVEEEGTTTDRVGDEEKRTPSNFDLMDAINDIDQALAYEKRAPYGFVGMRGKRAPKGFMGMRGKKDESVDEFLPNYDEKRAIAGFFGTRGKKQPYNSGFFGTRGKKYPYSLRSKFIGVRGKKDSPDAANLIDDDALEMNKRQPSGFVGMRGKKDSISSED